MHFARWLLAEAQLVEPFTRFPNFCFCSAFSSSRDDSPRRLLPFRSVARNSREQSASCLSVKKIVRVLVNRRVATRWKWNSYSRERKWRARIFILWGMIFHFTRVILLLDFTSPLVQIRLSIESSNIRLKIIRDLCIQIYSMKFEFKFLTVSRDLLSVVVFSSVSAITMITRRCELFLRIK